MTPELMRYLREEDCYVAWIIPVACAHDGWDASSPFDDWIMNHTASEIRDVFDGALEIPVYDDTEIEVPNVVSEIDAKGLDGFLVHLRMAVRRYMPDNDMPDELEQYQAGMDLTKDLVLYTPSLTSPEFEASIHKLVDESIEQDRKKYLNG